MIVQDGAAAPIAALHDGFNRPTRNSEFGPAAGWPGKLPTARPKLITGGCDATWEAIARPTAVRMPDGASQDTSVPIPFSVFPSAYRSAGTQESTQESHRLRAEGEARHPQRASHGQEEHEEIHESFTATVHRPQHHDTQVKEEVHVHEEEHHHRPQHREEVHIHEQTRYIKPEQRQVHQTQQTQQTHQTHQTHQTEHFEQIPQTQHTEKIQQTHQFVPIPSTQQAQAPQSPQFEQKSHQFEQKSHQFERIPQIPQNHQKEQTHQTHGRLEFQSRDRLQPQPSHSHIEVKSRSFDGHFDSVHGPASDNQPSQIDLTESQFRKHTRPIVAEASHTNFSSHAPQRQQQTSGYSKETFTANHTNTPYERKHVDSVDRRYPTQGSVRVEESARASVDTPKKFKRDMGYYDHEGQYHSLRSGIKHAAHKVGERIVHPIHPQRHEHSHAHSSSAAKYDDIREEVTVKESHSARAPAPAPARSHVSAHTHVSAPTHVSARTHVSAAAPLPARPIQFSAPVSSRPVQASAPVASRPVQSAAPTKSVVRINTSSAHIPSSPATAAKMTSANTITIPCHHIRIGDLLILQGRPCQVIRITTSSQTGQHRYLGVDLFTKQLHEESSFISNPAPSVVVQNMLGPVFKQYRVLDIREDGRVVAMTESGDVKQGLPILDQSGLSTRLAESFDSGRGSVRILVIADDGLEMAVDYKVVHGSRL
ncbi:hypothetical protein P153DRAFT_392284 [Dothidotthia symphoricarpi CBS 119687]|uniref:Translation initiation factor 5A-like N-terminal domain-containing protein n=1 Tax=Dothidotthia symphoricarpi CBS 119687 TaxID=1392245 RepID=A0A6A6ATT0_9PLEO|nr:uncharacterized protein P153DRAFT_392284 [Dothidotthia symphoricarpi CBS 119687]KAF2134996.1 hypothetical protein P153DRAFT_392284 [Dothidotthia symphoricarpi CBS 119687]